jgi:hypothetical protein
VAKTTSGAGREGASGKTTVKIDDGPQIQREAD